MEDHTDVAREFVSGVVSNVSSKHTTPRVSPRPAEADVKSPADAEEAKDVELTPRTIQALNQAMNKQGYIVTDRPEKAKEPGSIEEKEDRTPVETEEVFNMQPDDAHEDVENILSTTGSSEDKDYDEGIEELLGSQQSELEALSMEGLQSPTAKSNEVHVDSPFDDEGSADNLPEESHGPTLQLGDGGASGAALEPMSDDLKESSVYVEDLGTASNPHSPVLMKASPRHIDATTRQATDALTQPQQEQQQQAAYSPYFLDDGTANGTEVVPSEADKIHEMKVVYNKEFAVQARNEAKERQMKLREDARARRAAEIAMRKELENQRIGGVDTRVARGSGGAEHSADHSDGGGLSVSARTIPIGGVARRSSPHRPSPGDDTAASPSSGTSAQDNKRENGVSKSPLAQHLATQLQRIQIEKEEAGILEVSSAQANVTTSSSPKSGGIVRKGGGFELSKGAIGGLVAGTSMVGGKTSPEPFKLSSTRPRPPPENGQSADPGPGFYVDSRNQVREKDTGRVRGKGPGGSTPSVPTRDNKPRVGDVMESPYADGEYINPDPGGMARNEASGGMKKKPKYPFSQMRLEKQRAEIERSRVALSAEVEKSITVRESWEPSVHDHSVAASLERQKAEAERMRHEELEATHDENVTNTVVLVSERPYEPAPPREPPKGSKGAPGARLPSQRKKAAAAASSAAAAGVGGTPTSDERHNAKAGKERYVKNLLSPSKGMYADDQQLNEVISDIIASRSPEMKAKVAAANAAAPSTGSVEMASIRDDGVVDAYQNPQLKAALAASNKTRLPSIQMTPDLYDANGHLIPPVTITSRGTLVRTAQGDAMKPSHKRQKPLFMRMQEKAMLQEAQEEKIRQEKFIAYRLRKAEQQPTHEEIAEHKRLHDEGILRMRYEKMNDERKKLVGGVNYEPDDLVSPQYRGTGYGGNKTGHNGHGDMNTDEFTMDRQRAEGFKDVFNARANRGKKKRDWKYLDAIGRDGLDNENTLNRTSADDYHAGARADHTSGRAVNDFNNKYHRMAVQEMRKKKRAVVQRDNEKEKNLARQRVFAENVRETFLPHSPTYRPKEPLQGRKGRVGFDYDPNFNYDSPQRAAARRARNENYKKAFDRSKVEQMYAAAEATYGGSPGDRSGNQYDHDLDLTLSPRSSKFGQEYVSELLDAENDTEAALAGMYKKGFSAYFKKSARKTEEQSRDMGHPQARSQLSLIKAKRV